MKRTITLLILFTSLVFAGACQGDDGEHDPSGGDDFTTTDDTGTESGTGSPLDSDQDGLTDDEEALLGTDPLQKDTDADNYWDSWEVTEGTDPLDPESRIYVGYWPYNPEKDTLYPGDWNNTSTAEGAIFPRFEYADQHGNMVDSFDFVKQLNDDEQSKWMLIDVSAQWCPPCHNVATWLSGVDNADTDNLQAIYPTVREKISGGKIFWITIIVENLDGGPPSQEDAFVWENMHSHPLVPVLVDADQRVHENYGVGSVPHFFLLDPDAKMAFFPEGNITGLGPYPAIGMIDQFL